MILRKLYYALSPRLRFIIRKLFFLPLDFWNFVTNKRSRFEPKKGDIYVGSGDFIKQGEHQLRLLIKHCNIRPNSQLLDVGCGIGRTAVALTSYLEPEGSYDGFDVVKKGIEWCDKNIHKNFPNFKFLYYPLHNDLYNKKSLKAIDFSFPYRESTFDIVFLFSVFTHMMPAEIARYLIEISRVLKEGGECLATFFIVEDNEVDSIVLKNKFRFPHNKGGYLLMDEKVKSANVALLRSTIVDIIAQSGLRIKSELPGYWKDSIAQQKGSDFQDILIIARQ